MFITIIAAIAVYSVATKVSHASLRALGNIVETHRTEKLTMSGELTNMSRTS